MDDRFLWAKVFDQFLSNYIEEAFSEILDEVVLQVRKLWLLGFASPSIPLNCCLVVLGSGDF